ncbi:hypothetical protein [Bartonella sp. TP]|uniref:hypothetical protein n=1 Tax=Bartonella sp. TP TaxID=3057550 RepID=UPI0025B0EB45|nr:hypothetical protein [Bartonella sp. TP]WJW80499.1 hypothetical protein QVL57_02735 [Bartonella sp. TP]
MRFVGLASFGSFILLVAAFAGGFFYSKQRVELHALAKQIYFYRNKERLESEIKTMSDYQLCLALGGLRTACKPLRKHNKPNANATKPALSGFACG